MEHKRFEIGSGDSAIYNTLEHMKRLAIRDSSNPIILDIAKSIKQKCGENKECWAEKTFDYVYENIKYEYDDVLIGKFQQKYLTEKIDKPDQEEFVTAPIYLVTKTKTGDCDDMSVLLASIYIALGMPVNFKVIAHKNNSFSHVYTEVGLNIKGKWYWIPSDPVIKKFAYEKAPIIRTKTLRVN